jgi:hypothetical protein
MPVASDPCGGCDNTVLSKMEYPAEATSPAGLFLECISNIPFIISVLLSS